MSFVPVRRALLSVYDKTNLESFAAYLNENGVEILSTGGTAKVISSLGIPVQQVSDFTGFPEILNGRVKTLHPKIHGGILSKRDNEAHQEEMKLHDISNIDLVVVNLYPFETVVSEGSDFDNCIENIDIGGPSMIRSAAKNHNFVTVVVDPDDYESVKKDMENNKGSVSENLRRSLASRAFARTAAYDSQISAWLSSNQKEKFLKWFSISGMLNQVLRYGENPHQEAAVYLSGIKTTSVANAKKIQGKDLSYNNINDTDAAFELVSEFDVPAVAVIKHANPCGVAISDNSLDAYMNAVSCDPVSAFGGVVAINRRMDKVLATEITKIFTEVVIAPDADADAIEIFSKKKNLRLLLTKENFKNNYKEQMFKRIAGGFLVQTKDSLRLRREDLKVVTVAQPTDAQINDMLFAFTIAKHVKSNAIIYVKDGASVGIGAGQMSRLDSARIAASKALEIARNTGLDKPKTLGSVVASDAFFPFKDGLLAALDAGAEAVIQPGGSMRDDEVIAAADERGIPMVFTGVRHFRH